MKTRKLFSFLIVVALLFGGFIFKPAPAKAIKNFTVEVTPKVCGEVAEYKFSFTFEDPLNPHQWKSFLFPPGTTLKPPLPDNEEERKNRLKEIANAFRIENKEPEDYHSTGLPVIEDKDGWLNIRFSSNSILVPDKEGSHTVTMIFSEKAGICNPSKAGEFTYKLGIQNEPNNLESQPVSISDLSIDFVGGTQGNNGWFTNPPKIKLTCSNPNETIFYSWNTEGKVRAYQGMPIEPYPYDPPSSPLDPPSPPMPAQIISKLRFWTKSIESITADVKLDLVPPEMIIESPDQDFINTDKNSLLVKGRTTLIKTILFEKGTFAYDKLVWINEKPVMVSDSGYFSQEVPLKEGINAIKIRAEDEAGNQTTKSLSVTYSYATIIIQLTIGSTEAIVNGEPKTLPLAPFIQKGYTLVPFRFIGESLNATVDFTTDPTTKQVKTVTYELDGTEIVLTIGYLRAMVNGNPVLLDVPPQINNGTTVVPLRFVSSNLGCKIDWDPVQLKITLSYPEKPNNGDTLAVVEDFDAIWLLKSTLFDQPKKELLEELGSNRLVYITYYVDSTDDHPFPRLSCQESWNRMKWYMKDKGIPSYFFNGTDNIKGIPSDGDDRANDIKKALKKNILAVNRRVSPIKLMPSCTHLENKTYQIKVEVERLGAMPFSNLQLVCVLTENNIPYVAISSRKIHNYVFREFLKPKEIKDSIGIPFNLAVAGGSFKTEFTFDLNTDLYKNDLNLIFFVQDMTQKTILQGKIIPLEK